MCGGTGGGHFPSWAPLDMEILITEERTNIY
jgi:hypothetical protein